MPEKDEKLIIPTGDYSFRMPSTVNLTMPVSVEPMEEEVKVDKPPAKSKWGAQLFNLAIALGKLAAVALFAVALYRVGLYLGYFRTPPPPPPDMTRYVIARQAVLAEYPGGYGNRYALDQGYPVTYMGEMHQLTDGRVWMRVQAQYGPAAQPYKVNGWMQADKLSE